MRPVVVCLAALLAAGCESEKKPTEPAAPAPFPGQPAPPKPGKKQTGPGMSHLPAAPALSDRNS